MTSATRVRRGRRSAILPLVGAATAALLLVACSSASTATPPQRSDATNVAFTGCNKVACTGTLDGAKYEIDMPQSWNGTLLIYSLSLIHI